MTFPSQKPEYVNPPAASAPPAAAEIAFSTLSLEQLDALPSALKKQYILSLQAMPSAVQAITDQYGRATTEAFITEVIGEQPSAAALAHGITVPYTPGQVRVMESVRNNKRTAVHSGNGLGKTWVAAAIAEACLHEMQDTIVITTAPNARQVEQLLWGEIHSMRNRFKERTKRDLPGRVLNTSIHIDLKWYASGYTARSKVGDQSATGFAGVHSPGRVVVIVDEATDISEQTWEAIKRITVGPRDRILAIGNVTDPSAYFARVGELRRPDGTPMWNVIVLSGEDHPNVVFDDPEIVPGAVTREFIEDMLHESGSRDSAVYRSAVLGLAPIESPDGLIHLAWVKKSQALRAAILEGAEELRPARRGIALAVDVAGSGTDLTVLSIIEDGFWSIPRLSDKRRAWLQGRDPMEVADLIVAACTELQHVRVITLDDTGIGAGVTARLRQLQREGKMPKYRTIDGKSRDIWIIPKNFGSSSEDPRFHLVKDELWWKLSEGLRDGKLVLPTEQEMATWELPRGNNFVAQLTTPIYFRSGSDDGQKIEVFDKKGAHGRAQVTRNLPSKSPDIAHSCMLAWHGWNRLRADAADAKPLPRNLQELFDSKTREMMDQATGADKRKRQAAVTARSPRGKAKGPLAPWQKRQR